jgi:short-subunit dehydrogenase
MDDVHRTFSVNLFSHYQLVKEFLPHMIENDHGHIVTVASLAAHGPRTANVAYAASKAAALAFHEGLGLELALYYDAKKVRTRRVTQLLPIQSQCADDAR